MKKSWKTPELKVVARGKVDDSAYALRHVVTPAVTPPLTPLTPDLSQLEVLP